MVKECSLWGEGCPWLGVPGKVMFQQRRNQVRELPYIPLDRRELLCKGPGTGQEARRPAWPMGRAKRRM